MHGARRTARPPSPRDDAAPSPLLSLTAPARSPPLPLPTARSPPPAPHPLTALLRLCPTARYGLYSVVIFKKSLDEFKASAREKRYTLREFTYDANALQAEAAKKQTDEAEYNRLKGMLTNWCQINCAYAGLDPSTSG